MSTHRFHYHGGLLNLRYRAVAAAEYLTATVKAAFQAAAAPAGDPVKQLYGTFHDLHKISEDIHSKFRDQFPDWQHEGKDENGDTGLWRARIDCLNVILERLEQAGVMKRGPVTEAEERMDIGGNMYYLSMFMALHQFSDAASSEFRFRHALDYYTSRYDGMPRSGLERMAPVIQAALPELAAIDIETLRDSKEKHAAELAAHEQKYNPPSP